MGKGIGVRGRLLVAFFGISAFVVLASAAAVYSFLTVGGVLDRITQQRMPSALNTLEIARQAEQIVAAAPSFLTVTTATQREQLSSEIAAEVEYLNGLVTGLKTAEVDASALEAIEAVVARLGENLRALDLLVANRITARERKRKLLSKLSSRTNAGAQRALYPGIRVMDAKFSQLRRAAANPDLSEAQRTTALRDLAEAISNFHPMQKAQVDVSAINDTLLRAASAESLGDLKLLEFPLRRSLDNLARWAQDLDPRLQKLLEVRVEEFRSFIGGSDSLLEARRKELDLIAKGEELLSENIALSRQLKQAAGRLVAAAKEDIAAAGLEVTSVQDFSTAVLVAVVALSLISSTLIVWLYVGRNLIARLTALSDSMLAIAGGNLKMQLPPGGADEIGRMAEALAVFRDTAVEVEATNLREIAEARRRLTDAIESISEGFSLYDAEDKLVICNSRYHEQLYPGMSEVVKRGTSFETVIRAAVERDLVDEVSDFESVDDWVENRLERHRNPSGSFVQRRGKQQWLQISERRTEDGGYVAVYTDITEIKDREEELAEKSRALEQLSNQLAKYLSPQVYNSIFSGKQEVKVTSNRKKLTVFFSDIADFTEMADRLESEELTQLLNHYLTEMSQIALDHGATIDKYVGDAILIFFGDPETKGVKEDALACVKMAIAMRSRMHDLGGIWRQSGIEKPLRVRMGIHTDYCTVGNFGSEDRMDYTIIGGGVNTASRLEALATPGEILISYETFALVSDPIACEEQGEIDVKGIAYPIATYRVVDLYANLDEVDQAIRTELPHLKLDVDVRLMSAEERQDAATVLQAAANRLSTTDATKAPRTKTSLDA